MASAVFLRICKSGQKPMAGSQPCKGSMVHIQIMLMPWVQGKTDDKSALKNGGITRHAPGEAIQSFIFWSHLEKETFTKGGKISSGNPLIIFTFGDVRTARRIPKIWPQLHSSCPSNKVCMPGYKGAQWRQN